MTSKHQDVKDHYIGVFQQMMLFQEFDGLANDIPAATCPSWGSTGLNAFHAIPTFCYEILRAQFFGVKVDLFEDIDHCGL